MNWKRLAAWLLVGAAAVGLTSCSDDSPGDSTETTVTYPRSNDEPLDRSDPRDPRSGQSPSPGSPNDEPEIQNETDVTSSPPL